MNPAIDPLDVHKAAVETDMIQRAEEQSYVAMFGKAAHDRDQQWWIEKHPGIKTVVDWSNAREDQQERFVLIAKAVIGEARRAGWF